MASDAVAQPGRNGNRRFGRGFRQRLSGARADEKARARSDRLVDLRD